MQPVPYVKYKPKILTQIQFNQKANAYKMRDPDSNSNPYLLA